jgi:hypothetical protein
MAATTTAARAMRRERVTREPPAGGVDLAPSVGEIVVEG